MQADFDTIFAAASVAPPGDLRPAFGLEGVWVTQLNLEVLGPLLSSESMNLTERGREAAASFREGIDSPAIDCVAFPAPTMMLVPDIKSIDVRDDIVIIRGEFDAAERVVFLGQENHDGASPSIQGHSIGRFDGDALVIDTTHFTPHRAALGDGVPSSPRKHLTERLEPSADGTTLVYSFELDDPEYLAEPITGSGVLWWHQPDVEFVALPCDADNARRFAESPGSDGQEAQ